jgi:hypothetical protein
MVSAPRISAKLVCGITIAAGAQTVRRGVPGWCVICLAADTHRPLEFLLRFVTT